PLINSTLRGWSEDEVLVVSDAGAPSFLVDDQHYFPDHVTSHAAALRAGLDSFTDADADSSVTLGRLSEALARGLITEADIDTAARRILTLRMRLGEFDPPEENPYTDITAEVINCPAHQDLARQAARRSMVLLTHRGLLPLRPERDRTVAVIGPLSDTVHAGWYSGTLPYAATARAGLEDRLGAAAVRWCEGVDRVALRVRGSEDYLTAADDPHGAPVRLGPAGPATHLDLFDWGGGATALRAAANERHLRVDPDGILVNDSPGPNGWVFRVTFDLVERSDGAVAVSHLASGLYLSCAT